MPLVDDPLPRGKGGGIVNSVAEFEARIIEQYRAGVLVADICKANHTSNNRVMNILRRNGVPTRGYGCKPLEVTDEDLAMMRRH